MSLSHGIAAVRQRLRRLRADAFLSSNLSNVRYLTGYTGSAGRALIAQEGAWFFTDFRYKTQAAEQVKGWEIVVSKVGLEKAAVKVAKKKGWKRIAFEAPAVTVATFEEMQKWFAPAELVSTKNVVEDLRVCKDESEITLMQRAVDIADAAFHYILGRLQPGRPEKAVAMEIEEFMVRQGADGTSFTPIVASGARSALPHGVASQKRLEKRDLITFDFGCKYQGYCSDLTRTVCLGKPTAEQQKVYRTVYDAQMKAEKGIRAGMHVKAADALARDHIKEQGYGDHFGHGLGHGVGLDIHEAPGLSWRGKGKLKPRMTVTIEPGIYIENWGGVRIEDMAVVTDDGVRVLTKARKPAKILAV